MGHMGASRIYILSNVDSEDSVRKFLHTADPGQETKEGE